MPQQLSLFPETTPVVPATYYPGFLSPQESAALYQHCLGLAWQQNSITKAGKSIPVPRLECMYGDAGCAYQYSGSVFFQPLPWTQELITLRDRLADYTGYRFNVVIGNQYRSGGESIGWHSDAEPLMGVDPAIASISLGSTRTFQLKPKHGGERVDFWLEHGSLLVMHPGCQATHVHQVPKTSRPTGVRINLTFRPHRRGDGG